MKPILLLVTIATVFIAGSIISSPLFFLLSSSDIAYGQTPDQALSSPSPSEQQQPPGSPPTFTPPSPSATSPLGQTPDQALSSPTIPSSPAAPSPNPSTAQPEGQPQPPGSQQSAIPGLLFPPEQPQQQPPTSQQQLPSPSLPSTQPIPQREQPPSVTPLTQTTANGTIDSLIFAPGTRWIATGNWSMILSNGNVNSFNADMTWYNNNGTGTHTHEILNFKSNPIDVTAKPGENVLVKGLTDVGTNHRISWTNVHTVIDIKGGKTISISLDDKETNKHFAGQAIYGVVKSFTQCSDQPGQNMEVLPPCSTSS
jgi:hypothetical protein